MDYTVIRRVSGSLVLLGLAAGFCGFASFNTDADHAEIITADVVHFWQAFDDAAKADSSMRAGIYRTEYFDKASQGLKDYAAYRHVTPETLAEHVEQNRGDYARLRPYINEVVEQKPVIHAAYRRLGALYPESKFPALYFIVGPQRGAGMNSKNGIILAADMFATPPGTPYSYTKVSPGYVPYSAVHETIHFNQAYETTDTSTLLQQVINEGAADFIADLVMREPDVRQMTDRWQYGCPREVELFDRFVKEQDQVMTSPWFFDHQPSTGWPPDMGYWLGYRIAQRYYHQSTDKHAALTALLKVTDFKSVLKASGYPTKNAACVVEKPVH